jgi:hypothetical protein
MSSYNSISSDKLSRTIGAVSAPTLIDVRIDEGFTVGPRLIPGAARRSDVNVWDRAPRLPASSEQAELHT